MKAKTHYLFLVLLFGSSLLFGQSNIQSQSQQDSRFILKRAISLDEDSKRGTIAIPIESETIQFELNIQSEISRGKLIIEIYDPKGKKQGNFSIVTQLKTSGSERVSGDFSKQIKDPIQGEWTIEIIPMDVNGEILITTAIIGQQ